MAPLKKKGVAGVFGPGTPMDAIVSFLRENLEKKIAVGAKAR